MYYEKTLGRYFSLKRILYSRKFWLPLIALSISLISILLYINIELILSDWFNSLQLAIGFIGIITTLFNYWRNFNLFVTKIWIILTNSTAIWNVSSNYEGDFSKTEFNNMIKDIKSKNSVTDYYEVTDTVVRFNINGLNYSLEYTDIENGDGTDVKGKVFCYLSDFNSSYDYSIKILEQSIIPYFDIIEKKLRPDSTSFNFKISFNGKNPFIRLITKNVHYKTVHSLWYTFNEETTSGKRNIKISDKSIECTTSSIIDFQRSSLKFISLVGE